MIYILEDDASIRELVSYAVQSQGLEISGFERPSQFWQALNDRMPELILLDIMLPEEDGLSILKKLKGHAKWRGIPVMMLSAKDTEYDKVTGLDFGADDYVAKPFGMMELLARIRVILRRSEAPAAAEDIQIGPLVLSPMRREVMVEGVPVPLTLKEFELLYALMTHAGQVLSREVLMERIWGGEPSLETRTLDVHIRTLRAKLGAASEMIGTVRGVGYKLEGTP